ncbi:hamartin [Nilaparvata lugens]|uniref:hamartin n=1 Tax=Nilaparvata lugens TaxID=108931 RepID=UPI00193D174A|nr:hamartin [Nilaparvata lugens]
MDFAADFKALESNQPPTVEEAKTKFHDYLNSAKEAWVMNGLLDYYFATGSLRVVEILIGIREPNDKFLFDRLSETMRGTCKLQSLTLLGLIARRNPTWLYKISSHSLLKELLRLLKVETDMLLVMSALLLLIILLPMIAGLIGPVLQEIFDIFSRLAAWNTNNPNKMSESYMLHLQVGLYALFHRLYGMFPCNFLAYLRKEYSQRDSITIFRHTIKPLLESVKMHPSLIISGKDDETTSRWWIEKAPHDIVVECASFAVETSEKQKEFVKAQPRLPPIEKPSLSSRSPLESSGVLDGCYTSRGIRGFSSQLQKTAGKDLWTPQSLCGGMVSPHETSAPTSIPLTPISQAYNSGSAIAQPEGTSPPEAAVEATPETTPIKDIRHSTGRGVPPIGSTVVRALNTSLGAGYSSPVSSQPSSPMRKDPQPYRFPTESVSAFQQPLKTTSIDLKKDSAFITQKMQKVLLERSQLNESREKGSPVPKPVQPSSPLRLINPVSWPWPSSSTSSQHDAQMDKEVESVLAGGDGPSGGSLWTRDGGQKAGQGGSGDKVKATGDEAAVAVVNGHAGEARRRSSGADGGDRTTASACVQTDACSPAPTPLPLPYEHLFASALPPTVHHECCTHASQVSAALFSPQKAVEASIVAASRLHEEKQLSADAERRRWQDHVGLINLQLQFERHRREVHAERNRRLLGASRVNRSIEEHNVALKEQVALLQSDTDRVAAELQRYQREAATNLATLRDQEAYWRDQATRAHRAHQQLTSATHQLHQQLSHEREKTVSVTKCLDETKATLYNTAHELQLALSMVNSSREASSELAAVQRQLVMQGETQLKVRDTLANVARSTNRAAQLTMLSDTFNHQIKGLSEQVEAQKYANDALAARVLELEGLLVEKDKLIEKQKITIKEANLKHSELYKKLEGQCSELSSEQVRLQEREVDYISQVEELTNRTAAAAATTSSSTVVKSPTASAARVAGVSDRLVAAVSGGQYSLLTRASSLLDNPTSNLPMRSAQQMAAIDLQPESGQNPPDSTK